MNREIFGSFPADQDRRVEEVDVCHQYAGADWPLARTLIDVGAHRGSSSIAFLRSGWKVAAFEPDPENRAHLLKRCAEFIESGQMTVDVRAVSDHLSDGVPFYASGESSGVSSMLNFLESHEKAATVPVTTLTQYLLEFPEAAPGILKIDTEGFDLHVLRGFPWEVTKPGLVVVEFEDKKSQQLGTTCVAMQEYLASKGYRVLVSEWHPIVRYGISHQWKALWRAPKLDLAPESWGNLVAIREDLPEERFLEIFESQISTQESREAAAAAAKSSKPKKRKLGSDERHVKHMEPMKQIAWAVESPTLAASLKSSEAAVVSAAEARASGNAGSGSKGARAAIAVAGFFGIVAAVLVGFFVNWLAALAVLALAGAGVACFGVGYLVLEIRSLTARLNAAEKSANARVQATAATQKSVSELADAVRSDSIKVGNVFTRFDRQIGKALKRTKALERDLGDREP